VRHQLPIAIVFSYVATAMVSDGWPLMGKVGMIRAFAISSVAAEELSMRFSTSWHFVSAPFATVSTPHHGLLA
jgi:hypothetical protein